MGLYGQAANAVLTIQSVNLFPGTVEEAARLLRTAPATAASPQSLPPLGALGFVYLYVGALNRAIESLGFLEDRIEGGYSVTITPATFWHPSYTPVRKTDRFKAYVRKAGLVDYWRARGWPEFCHPTTADDFVCD
jgi:hypothetical protein